MDVFGFTSKALATALAVGMVLEGAPALAAGQADQATDQAAKSKLVCKARKPNGRNIWVRDTAGKSVWVLDNEGQRICRKVAYADPNVAKSKGFFQSVGLPLAVGGAGITAAAVNTKNCGRGNNASTGGGQNNGNCPASP